nr:outer membrane beta-barrel protein [uncultured Chitinophaga sp.]
MKLVGTSVLLMLTLMLMKPAQAQEITNNRRVAGKITDENKQPLEFATVVLFKAADSSIVKTGLTEAGGKFLFADVSNGQYYVLGTFVGFTKRKSEVFSITDDNPSVETGVITLTATSKTLKRVDIVAEKPLFERKIDRVVMNVSNSSISTGSTALEVLQRAPGVVVDQNDKILMKGKSGVLVLLDGKPTYMSAGDLANVLRSMQSSQIESIELITNPPAKYDAAGNSGIINIKTVRSKSAGTNGSFSAGINYWDRLREYASINLNHRSGKFNIFGNYSYSGGKRDNHIMIDRVAKGTPDTYFSQDNHILRAFSNNYMKAGADYFINKNNTIGVLVTGYFNNSQADGNAHTLIGTGIGKYDSALKAAMDSKEHFSNLSYNVNYKARLDSNGQELTADLDYSRLNGKEVSIYNNTFYDLAGKPLQPTLVTRNMTPTTVEIKAFKADYLLPMAHKLKFEAGIKSSWVKTDNNFAAEQRVGEVWKDRENQSNHFIYDENVNAAYVNFNKEFRSTSVQAGLRVENTSSKGNSLTTGDIVKRNYTDFFPSVFIRQQITKKHILSASFSRRIDRPDYASLNPFVYYLDQYTYQKGNPFLNPQYTNNFELSYTLMDKYNLTLSYSKTRNVMTETILPDTATKGFYQMYQNLDNQYYYGLSISVPVRPFKWWSIDNNFDVYNLQFNVYNLDGARLASNQTSWQFKTNNSFDFGHDFRGELSFNYRSAANYGVIKSGEQYSFDMGLSKSFLKNKYNIKFAISDLFNTFETNLQSAYPGFDYRLYQKLDSRRAKLTFTYRFGNKEVKPARRHTSGTEAEQSRLKD